MDVLNLEQLLRWKPPPHKDIIADGILYADTAMILYGEAGSFKSMMSIHTAFTIAEGLQWFGHQTTRSKVLLGQSEIPQPMFQKRTIKYVTHHNTHPNNLYFFHDPGLKLDRTYGFGRLLAVVKAIQPDVLILDPLYKMITGHVENSHDISALLDNLDILKYTYHCSIIIIHHKGKNLYNQEGVVDRGGEGMMGSSYLLNWPDTRIIIESDTYHDLSTLTFDNVRHAETVMTPIHLKFNRNTLGWKMLED